MVETIDYPNKTSVHYLYDQANRIKQINNKLFTADITKHVYEYDQNGNRVRLTESNINDNQIINYEYDKADRLTKQIYPNQSTEYVLDKVGNRTSEVLTGDINNTKTYSYNTRDQLTTIVDNLTLNVTYTYDNAGNQLTKDENGVVTTFNYTPRQRVGTITVGGAPPANYAYDYTGQRIRYRGQGLEKRYLYDGLTLIGQTNVIGNTIARYHYGDRYQLAETREELTNSYFHVDSLGTNVAVTTVDGNLVARYEYDAYGKTLSESGTSLQPFGFTGYQKDEETDLYYANARYYDSNTGRFLREDPFDGDSKIPPSLHRYLYAYVNPATYVDPTGKVAILKDFADWLNDSGKEARELSKDLHSRGGFFNKVASGGVAVLNLPSKLLGGAVGAVNTVANVGITSVDNIFGGNNFVEIRQENIAFDNKVANTINVVNERRFQLIPDVLDAVGSTIGRTFAGDPDAFFYTVQGGAGLFGTGWLNRANLGPPKLDVLPQYRDRPIYIGESSNNKIQLETPTQRPPIPVLNEKMPVITGIHKDLRKNSTGGQSHHLNQDAAFRDRIPTQEAATVKLQGNAFTEIGSPHFKAHQSLEIFWNKYRRGGELEGTVPTNLEYTNALLKSLKDAGFNKSQALEITRLAIQDRVKYGVFGGKPVPRLPGRINQKKSN